MIEFKVASTRYKVATPEKQALVEAYCSKITKRTGRHSAEKNPRWSSNPHYCKFQEGMSTERYVREYERLNDYRFAGTAGSSNSLFDNLSKNPQFSQDDSHIEELNHD